jgi:hypothetical protein
LTTLTLLHRQSPKLGDANTQFLAASFFVFCLESASTIVYLTLIGRRKAEREESAMRKAGFKMLDSLARKERARESIIGHGRKLPAVSAQARALVLSTKHRGLVGIIAINDGIDGVSYWRLMPGRIPAASDAESFAKEPANAGFDFAVQIQEEKDSDKVARKDIQNAGRVAARQVCNTMRALQARSNARLADVEAHPAGEHSWKVDYSAMLDLSGADAIVRIELCRCGACRVIHGTSKDETVTMLRSGAVPAGTERKRGRPRKIQA